MFYTFRQNNTGGKFVSNDSVGTYVIIEAANAKQAVQRAEEVGLYFDGDGDCECCGNRWNVPWDDQDATEVPVVYGEPAESYKLRKKYLGVDETIHIYYLNGDHVVKT